MPSVGHVITTTYGYDIGDERVQMVASSSSAKATTTYPYKLYNIATSTGNKVTITKHIFANGEPVADVQGSTTTAAVYYIHDDHLQGADTISNAGATIENEFSYYPFGGTRIAKKANTYAEQRRFTGHEYDTQDQLSYMDARYYNSDTARFLSEDPSFNDLGTPNLANDVQLTSLMANPAVVGLSAFTTAVSSSDSNRTLLTLSLADPQSINSYSYVENNPIKSIDPNGKNPLIIAGAVLGRIALGVPEYFEQYSRTNSIFLDSQGRKMVAGKTVTGAVAGTALAFGQPALAAAIVAGGTVGVSNLYDPTKDPAKQGSRFGKAIGEGLTLNVGDDISSRVVNPVLKKINQQLYTQTAQRVGGIIDAGQDYVRLLLGKYGFTSASSQGGARSAPGGGDLPARL